MALRPEPVESLEAFAANVERRLKRVEATLPGRVLPQGYSWRVNGFGQLEVYNIDTGAFVVVL